jgi:hypothetical protein
VVLLCIYGTSGRNWCRICRSLPPLSASFRTHATQWSNSKSLPSQRQLASCGFRIGSPFWILLPSSFLPLPNCDARTSGAPAALRDIKVLAALTTRLAQAREPSPRQGSCLILAYPCSPTLTHPHSSLSAQPIESPSRDPFLAPGQRGRNGLPRMGSSVDRTAIEGKFTSNMALCLFIR